MSEQVGASLVLAQLLLPTQSTATGQGSSAADPLLPNAEPGALNSVQPIDSVEENAPVFASLLTELENLEARTPATAERPVETLIRVRVETAGPATETGSDLPVAGKLLPQPGVGLTDNNLTLPIEPVGEQLLEGAIPAEAKLGEDGQIVVREPGSAENPDSQPRPMVALPGSAQQPSLEVSAGQPTASVTVAAASSSPAPAPIPQNPEPSVRTTEGQLAAAGGGIARDSAVHTTGGDAGDSAGGQNQGERAGDRQVQANSSPRGPSITFSLEGLPNATVTTPATAAAQISTAPLLSQPLTLLGQPAQWADPLAERLAGLATRGANTAEIRLHPPNLGQLDVRITVANDQATLFVASANPDVREALQQALPRLDSLLSSLGIELAESEIAERQTDGSQAESSNRPDVAAEESGEVGELADQPDGHRLGLLDTWA